MTQLNLCNSSPCKNGANCVPLLNQYTCNCLPGTTGVNCQIIINQCDSKPCFNNATCQSFINSYQCICGVGFTGYFEKVFARIKSNLILKMIGQNCQSTIDYCKLTTPCQNNATCINNNNNPSKNFVCNCQPGYSGQFCEVLINVCSSIPCLNGGTCLFTGVNTYMCQCLPNWTGSNCQQPGDLCSCNPCQNGGTCQNTVGNYLCKCQPNWQGFKYAY